MEFKLIIKKLNNTLSAEEAILFSKWYKESQSHRTYFDNVKSKHQDNSIDIDLEKGWNAITSKIDRPTKRKLSWKFAVAASVAILISLTYIYKTSNDTEGFEPRLVEHNISIGINKATLTLEDGSDINLMKGETYVSENLSSNGEQLIYSADQNTLGRAVAYNYVTVPRGGEFFIKLQDGTQVWLNADSQIKYPVTFIDGETRQVELVYGEAYFDVSPSTAHKGSHFMVKTLIQNIEVIGTEFNVKAYKDEAIIYTTLVEGKVSVANSVSSDKNLVPGEQSILNIEEHSMEVIKTNITTDTAWKNGLFIFDKEPLKNIMTTLSRWYNIKVEFKDSEKENIIFSGVLNRNNNIIDLLDSFKETDEVDFIIKNKSILVQ